MSAGELEHTLVREMIKHQLHTFPQSSALPAAPPRASRHLSPSLLTKRQPQKDTDVAGLKTGTIKRPRLAPKPVRAGEGRSVVHPARAPSLQGKVHKSIPLFSIGDVERG